MFYHGLTVLAYPKMGVRMSLLVGQAMKLASTLSHWEDLTLLFLI